ncbi:RpnC/YadD family protein [Nonomuraea solani]|uniref:hypothetical protein n=1 Tax=Nonomuraea solani TaxID=1144553 RepID=UPI001F361E1E|nr:hypothetical protein [Nonomuraea solani]
MQLFKERPKLAVDILRDLKGIELPDTPLIQLEDNNFNSRTSDDFDADVVVAMGQAKEPLHAVIVEVQQDKSKDPKQLTRYAAAVWLLLRCDVTLLMICPTAGPAAHYAQPIDSGLTDYRLQVHTLGPDEIPAITDPQEAAASLALSALGVMVHGRDRKVVEAFTTALAEPPGNHSPKYYEYAYSMSTPEIRRLLEEIAMSTTWPVHSPFAREHFGRGKTEGIAEGKAEGIAEGKAEGKAEEAAKLVLLVLSARGLDLPQDARTRITHCTDLTQLETWATRAATAQTLADLFDE